jgi:hypothetical protein
MGDCFTNTSEHKRTKSATGKSGTPPENDREGNLKRLTGRKTREGNQEGNLKISH